MIVTVRCLHLQMFLIWVNECCIRQESITVYCLCMIKCVRVSILERLYLSIHPWRLVLDQLLGEGPDHKNLRILFDLRWPWKINSGFKSSSTLESIGESDWLGVSNVFVSYHPKESTQSSHGVRKDSIRVVLYII